MACRMAGLRIFEEFVEFGLERPAVFHRQIVEQTLGRREDDRDLLFDRQRRILRLLQNLDQPLTAIQLRLRRLIEIGAELREGRQFAILREIEPQRAGHLLHGLDLRVAADAAHRKTHVDGGPDVRVEQIGFQINLAVGDRDDVGRNVGRNVARLGFDERQRGERAAALRVAQFRGALQQAAVQIEHVAGVRFAARRTAQQQRNLAIGRGVLGKIVVNAERVAPANRGSIRPWRSRNKAPDTAWARDRKRSPKPRWCIPWRRNLRASSPPAPRSSASGRWRHRCRSRRRPSG